MERFIEAVRQYPCLWNVSSKEYRNIDKKEDAWKSIVDDLNLPEIKDVKAAKSEWKKLRDNHRDSLKRMKTTRTGQAATNTNTWKYAELLEFLLPYMKNRSRSTNLNSANTQSSETPETPETSEVRDDEDANNSEISVFSSNDAINNTARRVSEAGISQEGRTETRKRNAEGDFIQLLKKMEQNHEKRQEDRDLRRAMTNAQEKKDAIDLFLKSMAITIKTMPTWMQNRIKKKIFLIVSDAEEELQNYSYPGSVNNTLPAAAGSSHTANYEYSTSASAETVNNTIPAAAGSSSSANTIYHEYSRPGTFEPSPLHDYDN